MKHNLHFISIAVIGLAIWSLPSRGSSSGMCCRTHDTASTSPCTIPQDTIPKGPYFLTRKDTVVFIPSSFRLPQDSRLSLFLQQIPGFWQKDNQLYWNEKEITLQVNRKEVFGGWGILARIPCDIIKEILVYNSMSTLTAATLRNDQEEDYILDIILNHSPSHPLGDTSIGVQNHGKYEIEIDGMGFSSAHPFMVFANVNNRNRSTSTQPDLETSSEIGQYGKQQYASLSYQHNWQTDFLSQKLSHYAYANSVLDNESSWGKTNHYKEFYTYNNSYNYSLTHDIHHQQQFSPSLKSKIKWNIHPTSNITMNLDVNFFNTDSRNETSEALFNGEHTHQPFEFVQEQTLRHLSTNTGLINIENLTKEAKEDGYQLDAEWKWKTLLRRKNKLEVKGNLSHQNTREKYNAIYDISYPEAPSELLQQYNENPVQRTKFCLGVFYKHWVTRQLLFTGNYTWTTAHFQESQNHYQTEAKDLPLLELMNFYDKENSFHHETVLCDHLFDATWVYNWKQFSFIPRLSIRYSREKAEHHRARIDTVIHRNKPVWNPSLKVKWDLSPTMQAHALYEYTIIRPDLLAIIPWIDATHPLRRRKGNSRLLPSKNHLGQFYFQGTFPQYQLSLFSKAEFRSQSRPVTTIYCYNDTNGSYTLQDANALRPTYSFEWFIQYDQHIASHWRIRNGLRFFQENRDGFLTTFEQQPEIKSNRQNLIQFQIAPQITYDNSISFKSTLYAHLVFTGNQYQAYQKEYHHLRLFDYGIKLEKSFGNLIFQTDIHDRINQGYNNPHVNGHRLLWDATVFWYCLRGKGKLQLTFNDILNNTNLYSREIEPHQHTETYQDKLHHYLYLTFTYHLWP